MLDFIFEKLQTQRLRTLEYRYDKLEGSLKNLYKKISKLCAASKISTTFTIDKVSIERNAQPSFLFQDGYYIHEWNQNIAIEKLEAQLEYLEGLNTELNKLVYLNRKKLLIKENYSPNLPEAKTDFNWSDIDRSYFQTKQNTRMTAIEGRLNQIDYDMNLLAAKFSLALHDQIEDKNEKNIDILIDLGANTGYRNYRGKNALEIAWNNKQLLEKLIELSSKATLKEEFSDGKSVAFHAFKEDNIDLLELLINLEPSFVNKDHTCRQPSLLQLAAGQGNVEMVKLLLQKGANPNEVLYQPANSYSLLIQSLFYSLGKTPIHFALEGGLQNEQALDVVVSLREYGASLTIPDNRGLTSIDLAEQQGLGYSSSNIKSNNIKTQFSPEYDLFQAGYFSSKFLLSPAIQCANDYLTDKSEIISECYVNKFSACHFAESIKVPAFALAAQLLRPSFSPIAVSCIAKAGLDIFDIYTKEIELNWEYSVNAAAGFAFNIAAMFVISKQPYHGHPFLMGALPPIIGEVAKLGINIVNEGYNFFIEELNEGYNFLGGELSAVEYEAGVFTII